MFYSKNTMAGVTLGSINKDVTGFDPRSIGGCALWLDAADSGTITSSLVGSDQRVTSWRDKSGVGNTATTTGASRPYYVAADTSVYFKSSSNATDGTNNFLNTALSASVQMESIFFIGRTTTLPADGNRTIIGSSASAGRQYIVSRLTTNMVSQTTNEYNPSNTLGLGANTTVMGTCICTGALSGTTILAGAISLYVDGQLMGTNASNIASMGYSAGRTSVVGNTIGNTSLAGNQGLGYGICELIVYQNVILSSLQRQAIEGYLVGKWTPIFNSTKISTNLPALQPFKVTRPRGGPFTPLGVPNCNLWLDAADPSSYTLSGSTLTAWTDKSGNTNSTSSIVGTPTYSATGLNSLPGFLLNGSSAIIGPNVNAGTTVTVFAVATMNDAGTNSGARLVSLGASGVADTGNVAYAGAITRSGTAQTLIAIRNGNKSTLALSAYDTPFICSTIFDATNNVLYTNGTTGTTVASTGSFNYSLYGIGRDPGTGTAYWYGYVSEILVYNRAITLAERQQIEGYLANKWRIRASLAATQPFKSYLIPQSPLFLPNQLTSTLSAWYDGRDPNNSAASVPANAATLATWTDKSGNALNGTGVNAPKYSLANRAVQFVRASVQYYTTSLSASSATETFFVVAQASTATTNTIIGATSTGARRFRLESTNFPVLLTSGNNYTGSTAVTTGSTFMISCSYNASASGVTMRLNGTAITVSNTNAVTVGAGETTYIGAAASAGNPFNGFIMEICIYSGAVLSLIDIQRVEGYLAWKWNLNSLLPSTHPYYKIKL